jgi:archaellum biogenesis ATPase FlaH
VRVFDSPWAGLCRWILRFGIGAQRADFCLIFGSGERGKSPVSAERMKNGACDNGFKVGYFG